MAAEALPPAEPAQGFDLSGKEPHLSGTIRRAEPAPRGHWTRVRSMIHPYPLLWHLLTSHRLQQLCAMLRQLPTALLRTATGTTHVIPHAHFGAGGPSQMVTACIFEFPGPLEK